MPAEVDQSFEIFFGYEIPIGGEVRLHPIAPDTPIPLGGENFSGVLSPSDHRRTKVNTVRLPALRMIVCVSLVCCKERANFEPGGVLGAGRIYPLVMVMSSLHLDSVRASVRLTRPRTTMPVMGNEEMAVEPKSGETRLGSFSSQIGITIRSPRQTCCPNPANSCFPRHPSGISTSTII